MSLEESETGIFKIGAFVGFTSICYWVADGFIMA
jgi:hypothetical protein